MFFTKHIYLFTKCVCVRCFLFTGSGRPAPNTRESSSNDPWSENVSWRGQTGKVTTLWGSKIHSDVLLYLHLVKDQTFCWTHIATVWAVCSMKQLWCSVVVTRSIQLEWWEWLFVIIMLIILKRIGSRLVITFSWYF